MTAQLRDHIQAHVDDGCDRIADRGSLDFVEDFAAHIPGHVIGHILGVPDQDCPQLRLWSENIVQYFDIDRSDARKELAETNTTEFYHYLTALKRDRARAPKQDLISQLIEAEQAGLLTEDEFISTCMLILMAGHGSTIDVLGSGLHSLLRFPDQMSELRRDPALIRTAIPEMFRFEPPLPFFHRYCTRDVEFHGQIFPRGSKFGLLYGAANRDDAQFKQADRFDIARSPNRHLAFGGGPHFCLGNHLARLDMEIVFTTLLQRFAKIELADPAPDYKSGLSVRGPKNLRIAVVGA
jgi:cytochrome P450